MNKIRKRICVMQNAYPVRRKYRMIVAVHVMQIAYSVRRAYVKSRNPKSCVVKREECSMNF